MVYVNPVPHRKDKCTRPEAQPAGDPRDAQNAGPEDSKDTSVERTRSLPLFELIIYNLPATTLINIFLFSPPLFIGCQLLACFIVRETEFGRD